MAAKISAPSLPLAGPAFDPRALLRRVSRWHEAARQRRALADLPPELLRDIGLDREAAAAEAARPVWDLPARLR